MKCRHCGQEIEPTLSMEEYQARAIPRLEAIDILAKKINDNNLSWEFSLEAERWNRLMDEQMKDEIAAGL